MELVHKAEKALEGPIGSLPPLPKDARKGLAGLFPWLALIGGVLQLLAAWGLYTRASRADDSVDLVNSWAAAAGVQGVNRGLTVWVWIGALVLLADAVILLMAFPKLQKKQKAGWDLLLLGSLLNVVYGIVSLFIDGRGGAGSLIWTLLWSVVGFYFLFQVREHFGGKAPKSNSSES